MVIGYWLLVIGDCGIVRAEVNGQLEYDLGYIVHHPFWRQSFGYEAARACVIHAFNRLNIERLVANMASDHVSSIAVAERPDMVREGQFRNPRNLDKLTFIYSLSRHDGSADISVIQRIN